MDPAQYEAIYRFGSLDLLKRRVDEFLEYRNALGLRKPRLDFSFVAMSENLNQLAAVSDYARSLGVAEISVHPVIGRHPVHYDLSRELAGPQLRDKFKAELRSAVAGVRKEYPDFTVNVLNPDIDPDPLLCSTPGYFSPDLPEGARIYTCDQSPFETVHILATGDVVTCEVLDEAPIGNLAHESLRSIWNSECYREFRRKYLQSPAPQCRSCVWKQAYRRTGFQSMIDLSEGMNPQLLRGWHQYDGHGVVWSKKNATAALANPRLKQRIRLKGTLAPGPPNTGNLLTVCCNGVSVGGVQNDSGTLRPFNERFSFPEISKRLYLEFSVAQAYRPSLSSSSGDSRDLGFALSRVEVE
jgi:hypothetical protein